MSERATRVKTARNGGGQHARENVRHTWSALRSMPRSRSYPLMGAILALGAPVGLLVARALDAGEVPRFASMAADVEDLTVTYAYVTLSTAAVFGALGHLLGRWFDGARLLSITDPLTGVFNRRHFEQRLAEETGRGHRYGHTTCVLCIDIDHLKAINDGFGHKAGDNALAAVGRTLSRNVQAIDLVARIGDDEFAVLLPKTSAAQASALSQRILTEVARRDDGLTGKLAISIGIAELNAAVDVESDGPLAAVDEAFYRAKAARGGHAAVGGRSPSAGGPGLGHPSPREPWEA